MAVCLPLADDGVHRHQQRVAHTRPVPGVRNQEGGNHTQFPDERGNPAADGGQAEKRQAGALPRPLPVLRLHGLVVRRHAQPDGREHPYLLRRTRVDKHQPPEDGRGVQYPPARHRKAHHRQIPGSVRERQDFPRSPLQHVPCRNPFRRQALRHHQAHHVASEPTHGSHDGVPLQRRTHRNGQFHAGTQEHKNDADIRENHQRKAQPRHGEPCRKVERHRGICRLHHLKRKAMKRDIIIIEDKAVSVTGNDVWMTATEIAGLFHTTVPAVNAVIKAVRKSDVLNDYKVCRYMQLENGLYADVYAPEIIILIAFRLNTYNTYLFRMWLVGKVLSQEKRQTYVMFIQNGKTAYC